MPKNTSDFKTKLLEQERRITLAIQSIRNGLITSVRRAARDFNVPRSTLQDRVKGGESLLEKHPNGCIMTRDEEEVLAKWIRDETAAGVPPSSSDVRAKANLIVAFRTGIRGRPLGKDWLRGFRLRHPEIYAKEPRPHDIESAKCEDPKIISGWFDLFSKTIMEYGIDADDIYNFDEAGFSLGATHQHMVITGSEVRVNPKLLTTGNREWVTSIECVSFKGWALAPTIIFRGKKPQEKWAQVMPFAWKIALSENGWTNNEIALRWLKESFLPQTEKPTRGAYRLLIFDGHGSHVTEQFYNCCRENNVITLCLPPHSSHLLQPLDVACFGPLKKAYDDLIDRTTRAGKYLIDKLGFLEMFQEAREDALSSKNIKSGFGGCGLVPFEPDRVVSKLDICLEASTPVSSPVRVWEPLTPTNAFQVASKTDKIKELMLTVMDEIPSPLKMQIEQMERGFTKALYETELLRDEKRQLLRELNREEEKDCLRKDLVPVIPETLDANEARIALSHEATCDPLVSPTKPNRLCGNCRNPGHTKRKCPQSLN